MNSQKKYDVFISYSRKDLDEVSTFVEMLKTRIPTLEVWMDLEGITAADEFDEKIISAIDASSYVIFAVSPNSNSIGEGSSKWTKKELVYAKNTGKKVIPVLLNGAELNNWFLFEFGRVDCIDSSNKHQIEKLLKNIAKWSNKELVKPQKEKKVLTIDEQQLLNEARTLKDRIEKNKRVAKIAIISVLALSVLTISIVFGINRHKAYKAIQYTVLNDSIAPYTIEISDFEHVNRYNPKKISIPKKIKKNDTTYLVTRIGDGAFWGCTSLTSVTIPNSVTEIEDGAFEGCKSLTSITIPNSVTSIGDEAFRGCSSLTSITIPNSITSIDSWAFSNCSNLTSITIPSSVIWIETGAFSGCSSLKSVTIPNSVKSIGNHAFQDCSSLKSITIPNSVTEIGFYAFLGCTSLTSVTIPNSVTEIKWNAFVGCSSLQSITVDAGNTHYDSRNNCNAIIETATNTLIAGCKTTTIPNSVKSIGYDAFSYCSSLTSITIPNSVTEIGWKVFEGTALYNNPSNWENGALYINDCLIEVDTSFVGNCTIKENTYLIADMAFRGCSSLTSVTIPNGVTSIGDYVFYGCKSLTSVTIPNSVKEIREGAFGGCSSLQSITVDAGNTHYDSRNNCNAIIETETNTLIAGCKNTTIPNSVTTIGDGAFESCESLTAIKIPNSVTWIGSDAFRGCSSLTSITIPNSETEIGWWAFNGCTNLKAIYIPRGSKARFAKMYCLEDLQHLLIER